VLLGAELFFELLRPERRTRPGSFPVLQNTELGWVLSGNVQSSSSDNGLTHPQRSFFIQEDALLDLQLQRFWQLEDLPNKPPAAEKRCEDYFKTNTTQDPTGRYIVRLPRRLEQGQVGESFSHAKQGLLQLERRL
jgi:hypothetical protein